MARKPISFLQAAVPLQRGAVRHYERQDELAFTEFGIDGKVKSINTPQETFRRVHEVMHARHTKPDTYKGVHHPEVANIIEDCRLHSLHWPWRDSNRTPEEIVEATKAVYKEEIKHRNKMVKDGKCPATAFAPFASTMRAHAVLNGMGCSSKYPFPNNEQHRFANQLRHMIVDGKHQAAALLLQEAFFGHQEDEEKPPRPPESEEEIESRDGEETLDEAGYGPATMEIIELPLVEPTSAETTGYRLAKSGAKLYRPALRRPVLPQRLFVKDSPVSPGGAILFDASGSMGVCQELLLDCCLRAPTASVAYYCGDDSSKGWLYIFAKDGQRAANITDINEGGNTVDGPAMDWLMQQDGPRIFVTDRGFCGSNDSDMQKVRLGRFEDEGEITVYQSYHQFQEVYPKLNSI